MILTMFVMGSHDWNLHHRLSLHDDNIQGKYWEVPISVVVNLWSHQIIDWPLGTRSSVTRSSVNRIFCEHHQQFIKTAWIARIETVLGCLTDKKVSTQINQTSLSLKRVFVTAATTRQDGRRRKMIQASNSLLSFSSCVLLWIAWGLIPDDLQCVNGRWICNGHQEKF